MMTAMMRLLAVTGIICYWHSNSPGIHAFQAPRSYHQTSSISTALGSSSSNNNHGASRRQWITTTTATVVAAPLLLPNLSVAADTAVEPLEMKSFIDPQGLFTIGQFPKSFYTLRRTQKGDLPDAKTGKGRRGASIFTGGNMAKAEVVAVERYPVRVLLEDNGIQVSDDKADDLSTFPKLAKNGQTIADWIVSRRDKENPQMTKAGTDRSLENVKVSEDGLEVTFSMKTEIDVQKPELLFEELGISQLFRITVAKASLTSRDGNLMVIFASALEQDYTNGVDGPALENMVRSFQALDQSAVPAT